MPQKILVVDDEDIIRESLSFILKKEGYIVEEGRAYIIRIMSSSNIIVTDLDIKVPIPPDA